MIIIKKKKWVWKSNFIKCISGIWMELKEFVEVEDEFNDIFKRI